MASHKNLLSTEAILAAAGAGLALIFMNYHRTISRCISQFIRKFRNPFHRKMIQIVENEKECELVVKMLARHCYNYKVLGFDCEWVTVSGKRHPIALLQLSSHEGLCALFRLCRLQKLPTSLRKLLEDEEVVKVGVGAQDDAQKLACDYAVCVGSTFDLRFLAAMTGYKAEGLGKLTKSVLNVELEKDWKIATSDWEAPVLNDRQLNYAADDALAGIEIYKKLSNQLISRKSFWEIFAKRDHSEVQQRLDPFYDVRFKNSLLKCLNFDEQSKKRKSCKVIFDNVHRNLQTRGMSTRSKALYDNCILEAPDGEILCTIDAKKAMWYLNQNLGTEVKTEPLTVRLNFEPAGRAVGEVGRYYQNPKLNHCVVCGRSDAFLRKNVVPREYRKHFPTVMKSHTSHDILLLCPDCHQASNMSDCKVRTKLSEICDAPLTQQTEARFLEVPELKRIKSAARALYQNRNKIPIDRQIELENILMEHFKVSSIELTDQHLWEAMNLNNTITNENYCQHGEKVVQKYERDFGGIIELEKLWRVHFLETMKPQYLPELWSINHNEHRLEIRAQEGRLDKKDLVAAGLKENLLKFNNDDEVINPTNTAQTPPTKTNDT